MESGTGPGNARSLADQVVDDPRKPPYTSVLRGFIGRSAEEGHTRLYRSASFRDYVEIPDEAILHIRDIPPERSPLGGSYVWVKADAEIRLHRWGGLGRRRTRRSG